MTSLLASSFLFAGPVAKVVVADEIIDKNDTAAQKVIKGKAVQGDHRKKRRIEREIR